MDYRVEKKFLCTEQQLQVLKERLLAIMEYDKNQGAKDRYLVKSLYFDTIDDQFYCENESGVDDRKKYRIRTYNNNRNTLHLEIKRKLRGYTNKEQCRISLELYEQLAAGTLPVYQKEFLQTMNRFYLDMAMFALRPRVVIEYERTAFVYPTGNVRITFDRNISASGDCSAFLQKDFGKTPILPMNQHILEVKYDELLPEFIAQALELGSLEQITFSKYYMGRSILNER